MAARDAFEVLPLTTDPLWDANLVGHYHAVAVFSTGISSSPLTPIMVVSLTVSDINELTIAFDNPVSLTAFGALASSWIISTNIGYPVTVLTVQPVSNSIILTTSEQTIGVSYDLVVPGNSIYSSVTGVSLDGAYIWNFIGNGTHPSVLGGIYTPDAYSAIVYFSRDMNETETTNKDNYSVDNGLQILSVEKINGITYKLNTSVQKNGITYTVTVNNVHDIIGNIIQ